MAVVGPVGQPASRRCCSCSAGSTTPTAGTVEVAGRPLTGVPERERAAIRRDVLGFVFQFFHLVPELDGEANVLLPTTLPGARRDGRRRAGALIDRLGLRGVAGLRPHQLSGGEQQRFALARALVADPPVVLADEPIGNLDATAGAVVLDLLRELADEGRAVVMVTHQAEATATRRPRAAPATTGVLLPDVAQGAGLADHARGPVTGPRRGLSALGVFGAALVLGVALTSPTGCRRASTARRTARTCPASSRASTSGTPPRSTARVAALPNLAAASYRSRATGVRLRAGPDRTDQRRAAARRRPAAPRLRRRRGPRPARGARRGRRRARAWRARGTWRPATPCASGGAGELRIVGIAVAPGQRRLPAGSDRAGVRLQGGRGVAVRGGRAVPGEPGAAVGRRRVAHRRPALPGAPERRRHRGAAVRDARRRAGARLADRGARRRAAGRVRRSSPPASRASCSARARRPTSSAASRRSASCARRA